MSFPRLSVALVAAAVACLAGNRLLRADDPPPAPAPSPAPLSDAEQARVKQLVENLGSDDFRVREAATKELTEIGEKARPALSQATKSDVPEVRFRADQILRRLDGAAGQRRLESDGQPGAAPGTPGPRPRPRLFSDDQFEKAMKEMERNMEEWRQQFEKEWGQGGASGLVLPWLDGARMGRARRHFVADGADLRITPRGATLTLSEKGADGVSVTTTYEGKSLDAIFAARPEAKDKPGVASVVEQAKKAEEGEKAREAQAEERRNAMPGSGVSRGQSVSVTSTPGHITVTVTDQGPDGKPVTHTYEGTDLESLKAEHPELADKLGGIQLRIGPGGRAQAGGLLGRAEEDEDGEEADETLPTGPFGLALAPVDAGMRAKLGLAEGAGLLVRAVREKSDAAAAGLKRLDVITAVNGKAVDAKLGIAEAVRAGREQGSLSFDVVRGGKPLTLSWKK